MRRAAFLTALAITGTVVTGNVEFPPSVEIVAHENTAALMKEMRPVTGSTADVGNIFADHNGRGLPKPAKYAGYTEPQPARLRSNVEVVFAEIR